MIEVFDEKDVKECLSEVKDSDIKTYAFCLLDWAVQKRKIQAIPLYKIKQARDKMHDLDYLINDAKYSDQETRAHNVDILVTEFYEIIDKLIETEGTHD